MTDNKDLKYIKQFETKPFIPKTETKIILEQQDLYPELDHEDIGSSKGYGPMMTGSRAGNAMIRASIAGRLEKDRREEERRRNQGLCTRIDCQSLAEEDGLCAFHKRQRSEATWIWKTTGDTVASMFVPGYAAAKTVVGAVSWVAGQASGSQSASDFGGNAIKDEVKSEAWDAAATVASGSSKFGGNYSAGVGMASSLLDWTIHQNHVDRGENYRSDCPICRN